VSISCLSKPVLDQLADWAKWESELSADPEQVESALVARLSQVRDLRRPKGLRHRLVLVLTLTACATLVVGSDSVTAIWQWAAQVPPEKLARLGARWNPFTRRFVVPGERTFRRVLGKLDGDALDTAVGGWVADVTQGQWTARRCGGRVPGPGRCFWSARSTTPGVRSWGNARSRPSAARVWPPTTC
jgi:hypothetical protein